MTHTLSVLCVCPPQEALRFYNQTSMQLQMLEFSRQRLVSDDEVSTACFKNRPARFPVDPVRVWIRLFSALSLCNLWEGGNPG